MNESAHKLPNLYFERSIFCRLNYMYQAFILFSLGTSHTSTTTCLVTVMCLMKGTSMITSRHREVKMVSSSSKLQYHKTLRN